MNQWSCGWLPAAPENHKLLGGPGHGDIAVHGAFNAGAFWPSRIPPGPCRTTRSNSRPLHNSGVSQLTRSNVALVHAVVPGRLMTQAVPSGFSASQVIQDGAELLRFSVDHRDATAADRGGHVGVREGGPDDRLSFRHDLFRRAVVDAQAGQRSRCPGPRVPGVLPTTQ